MVKKKRPEALKSPKSSPLQVGFAQHDINGQVAHVQEPTNGANYDLLTGSSLEDGQSTIAGIAYDQPTSAMNGAAHEREDFAPLRAAALVQRKDPVDDEPCSRAKMWDPVKDCNDPHTFQVDLPDYTPAGQNRHEQVMDSMMMDGHPYYDDHLYGQARDNLQRSTNSGTRGGASMGLFNYSQPQPMASGFQGNVSMRPQPFQAVHPYGQSQRRRQQRPGYGNISILPPHPEESSRQNEKQSLDLISRGAALIDTQTRQTGHLYSQPQGSALQFTSTESRMAASTAYPLPAHHTESFDNSGFYSSPSIGPNLPRRIEPNPHQRSPLQDQLPFQTAIVSKAISMARYAETMEQQSNYTEAMRAYKETCTLFQEAIIRSGEHQERTECNNAVSQ